MGGLFFKKNNNNKTVKSVIHKSYKILIADDDDDIHVITKMVLRDFLFEESPLEFISSYNTEETMDKINTNPDIAVVFLDVVMDDINSGLKIVKYIREEIKNNKVRIILRTGQPGEAPEDEIIKNYDINDYKLKTELTTQKMFTSMYSALRSYRDIEIIENSKKNLEKIIKASANLFSKLSLQEFLNSILYNINILLNNRNDYIFVVEDIHGIVLFESKSSRKILAATGKFENYINKEPEEVDVLKKLFVDIDNNDNNDFIEIDNGFIIKSNNEFGLNSYVYVEGSFTKENIRLIKLFFETYSKAIVNYEMNQILLNSEEEIILKLSKLIENKKDLLSNHLIRVSELVYFLSLKSGFDENTAYLNKLASIIHDIGMINIPENILYFQGKLSENDLNIIKEHPLTGSDYLSDSSNDLINIASLISKYHHEKYDGSGYPEGLIGDKIPLQARIVTIADSFDSMTHKRCYKDALSYDKALEILNEQRGHHFDLKLVDIFNENYKEIIDIMEKNKDS